MTSDPQSYDQLADHYERLTDLEGDVVGRWLPSALPTARANALDVGCGTGRHSVLLADAFQRVIAVDKSEAMVELATRRRPRDNIDYRTAEILELDGAYDLVFSSAVLHHVPDLDGAACHLRGLVAPGGRAVLLDVLAPRNPLLRVGHAISSRGMYRMSALIDRVLAAVARRPGGKERYEIATYGPWLDHLAADRFLTLNEFDVRYGQVFPGARFETVAFLRACIWDAPGVEPAPAD